MVTGTGLELKIDTKFQLRKLKRMITFKRLSLNNNFLKCLLCMLSSFLGVLYFACDLIDFPEI